MIVIAASVAIGGCGITAKPPPTQDVAVTQAQPGPSETVQALLETEKLREEIAALRNEIELQQNEIKRLRERQDDLYIDLDRRLRERQSAATGPGGRYSATPPAYGGTTPPPAGVTGPMPYDTTTAGAATAPPGATGPPPYSATTEPQTPRVGGPDLQAAVPPADQAWPGAAPAVPPVGPSPVTEPSLPPTPGAIDTTMAPAAPGTRPGGPAMMDEQAAYDAAFELLKQSRYNEAITGFNDVLARYPNGTLADDAQYWIAEALYVTRDFNGALDGFRKIVDEYSASDRVPDAMLKIGYIHYETGDKIRARQSLNEVLTRFPGSRVAISAQTRLQKMDREGG